MIEIHLQKLRRRDAISSDEERAIRGLVAEVRDVSADTTLIKPDVDLTTSTLLLEGFLGRYKDLNQGQRQITELHVAGDFADLHSFTLKRLDHAIFAFTRCKVAVVPHERLRRLTEQFPHLARVYWFSTNLDAAIHREWAVSLGRRQAISRIAHLFCELRVRLQIVGLADESGFDMPLTQTDLAECLGLTPVHVNRMLQLLRREGFIRLEQKRLTILNQDRLERVAEFNPNYLYLDRKLR